ncbi:unnamed protein product [Phytophthora lilii]|uniref:Unnamed protein product n=1 Tax=Phytophthora lilii TaxID=2077276 RepID=A0A9W6WTV0_9STRA|nr:unnamed protein product [Phytophthora lilii]
MNSRFLLGAIASLLVTVNADVKTIDHDQVQPFPQPEPTTDSEKSAVKYKPQLHISYGCHPYPAVQADGSVSAGLKWSGVADGDCKGSGLGSQVYSRSDWYEDKWAILYTWYFPKGRQHVSKYHSGHRHYWLYAIVWVDSDKPDSSTILGVSMSAGVGYGKETPPDAKYVINGTTVMFDSDYSFLGSKQGIELTTDSGDTQDLITWEQLTDEARTALSEADFGVDWSLTEVVMPMSDDAFTDKLKKAYPF